MKEKKLRVTFKKPGAKYCMHVMVNPETNNVIYGFWVDKNFQFVDDYDLNFEEKMKHFIMPHYIKAITLVD